MVKGWKYDVSARGVCLTDCVKEGAWQAASPHSSSSYSSLSLICGFAFCNFSYLQSALVQKY